MKSIAALLVASIAGAAEVRAPDPVEIVRRACERDSDEMERRNNYTWRESVDVRVFKSDGALRRSESSVSEVFVIDGARYARRVEKDGKPLDAKAAREEQEKFDREVAKRRNESESARRKRLEKQRRDLEEERRFRMQIPDAFTWRLLGEDSISGRSCYRLEAVPRPAFVPRSSEAKRLKQVKGILWIDKEDYDWVKVDAETVDTFSAMFGMLRMSPGTRFSFDQTYVNGQTWFPQRMTLTGNGRFALLLTGRVEFSYRASGFRRFSVESSVSTGVPVLR